METFEHRDRYLEIGLNIGFYRRKKGMTQEMLADLVGSSRSHISAIEAPNLVRVFSMDMLFSIAKALEIEPYKLLVVRD